MSSRTPFEQKWLQGLSFEVEQPEASPLLCPRARDFDAWWKAQIAPVRAKPTEVTVNQLALQLLEQFSARYDAAPRAHRTLGSRHHHCIATVFLAYARELRELRWHVSPPLVREPSPPPSRPRIAGLFLGEDEGEL
jgi:hypothetical protein